MRAKRPAGLALLSAARAAALAFCLGPSGAVTAISHGAQRRVVTGLPPLGTPNLSEVLGPHDVAAAPGGLLIPIGLGTDPARRARLGQGGAAIASGFTDIVDIAFDRRGRLLVLEIAANGPASGDPTGALHRIEADGTRTLIASDGLFTPTGVAAGPDGAYYVSDKGTPAGSGEVLHIRG